MNGVPIVSLSLSVSPSLPPSLPPSLSLSRALSLSLSFSRARALSLMFKPVRVEGRVHCGITQLLIRDAHSTVTMLPDVRVYL